MPNIFKLFTSPAQSAPSSIADIRPADQPTVVAIPTAAVGDTRSATEQIQNAIAHDLQCTLTIGEVQTLFLTHRRRPLSKRSLQRYCQNATIAAQMVTLSQGKEWLANEASALAFVNRYPIITLANQPAPFVHDVEDVAPPDASTNDDADVTPDPLPPPPTFAPVDPDVAAPTPIPSLVNEMKRTLQHDEFAAPGEIGDSRRIGELLIDIARLEARVKGYEDLIDTLKLQDTRNYERSTRDSALITKLTDDVRGINSDILNTMLQLRERAVLTSADDADIRRTRSQA